ncbi:MAG TPA: hypothetical protein VJ894_06620 [Cryomorphaceae bacterium]|nr:hypothetical protein [Cryomorphaceae bacterium]
MEKKRKGPVNFLKEVAIVVIGVLIAVSIGNYKESLDNQSYIEKTLLAIENEIKVSQTEVDTVLERHVKLFEALEEQIDNKDQSLGELVGSAGGFQVAAVKNVSLRFFVSNKAELLEFKMISQLLEIELHANALTDKIKRLADYAYEHVNDKEEEVKLKFAYLLANVIDGEQTLLESYAAFLEENGANLNPESQ